jgi:hypothetical protein
VNNNSTSRVRISYWIYLFIYYYLFIYLFTAAHITITENILTLALVAS